MLVRRISPAPRRAHSSAHSIASSPVAVFPPLVYTRQLLPSRLASMLATTHCTPKRSAESVNTCGRSTAAELMLTLSAPARSIACLLYTSDAADERSSVD